MKTKSSEIVKHIIINMFITKSLNFLNNSPLMATIIATNKFDVTANNCDEISISGYIISAQMTKAVIVAAIKNVL